MRDSDIRTAVRERLHREHASDPDTKIVEEMGIWAGSVRIDVAVINGELCGYELKSDRDTLERLPAQADLYSKVFDRVSLVVGEKHLSKARAQVPRWWGIVVARSRKGEIELVDKRTAKTNPKPDAMLIARLLWKGEALLILEQRGIARGYRSKSIDVIHRKLVSEVPIEELSAFVRAALKGRRDWLGQVIGDD